MVRHGRRVSAGVIVGALVLGVPPVVAGEAGGCAAQADAEGMGRAVALDLPVAGQGWRDVAPPATVDERAALGPVDRVGYCLELVRDGRTEWVWTSFEATGKPSDLALPTRTGDLTREDARGLTVRSNVAGVAEVTEGRGWLEMWPNGYETRATRQLPGRYVGDAYSADAAYDADDNPNNVSFGSFQVHEVTADAATPVLAVNRWATRDAAIDVGIGANPTGNPDWTFAGNAGAYQRRTLTTYGRRATVTLDEAPATRQLLPRDTRRQPWVTTRVAGTVAPGVRDVRLDITRDGETERRALPLSAGRFATEVRIPAALTETDLVLTAEVAGRRRVIRTIEDVVAGDVIVVHGQSNAEARRWGRTAHQLDSPFVRSFGTNWLYPDVSAADRTWYTGVADTGMISGAVGQWGMQLAHRIMAERGVPVAVVQGSHGGRPISWFLRDAADPANVQTNYGRLLSRLRDGGLADHVSAIFWSHGESDNDDAPVHRAGATNVITGLRTDLSDAGAVPPLYLMQVRNSPCGNSETIALREEQRRLAADLGVSLFSQNSLDAAVGCHWDFVDGYQRLGDLAWEAVRADVYRVGPPDGATPPRPIEVRVSGERELTVRLADRGPLQVDAGVERDFRVGGEPVVTSVRRVAPDRLVLTTSVAVSPGDAVAYVAHLGAGPWITNRAGAGLVAFEMAAG